MDKKETLQQYLNQGSKHSLKFLICCFQMCTLGALHNLKYCIILLCKSLSVHVCMFFFLFLCVPLFTCMVKYGQRVTVAIGTQMQLSALFLGLDSSLVLNKLSMEFS